MKLDVADDQFNCILYFDKKATLTAKFQNYDSRTALVFWMFLNFQIMAVCSFEILIFSIFHGILGLFSFFVT